MKRIIACVFVCVLGLMDRDVLRSSAASAATAERRVGFIDPSMRNRMLHCNAAAFEFARSTTSAVRLEPVADGWRDLEGRLHAPEEFGLIWFNQGDEPAASRLHPYAQKDLLQYVENGGCLLLSGAAGRWLNDLRIESPPPRI